MNAATLVLHWQICDAAKTHVSFAHTYVTRGTHRREMLASQQAFASAVQALVLARQTEDPGEAEVPTEGAWGASLEQQAALELVSGRSEQYLAASERYKRLGFGRKERDGALVSLCRALDIITFYRNGPQPRLEDVAAPLPPSRTSRESAP